MKGEDSMKCEKLLFILCLIVLVAGCGNSEEEMEPSNQKMDQETSETDLSRQAEIMANDEKIIEMLKDAGEIPEDASSTEIQDALENYLQKKAQSVKEDAKSSQKYIDDLKKQIQKDFQNNNN